MRTIFKKRQEYYKAIAAQKELAEESKFKTETASEAIKETLLAAMRTDSAPVEEEVTEETPVEEEVTEEKPAVKKGRKKAE